MPSVVELSREEIINDEIYGFTPQGETIYLLQPHDTDNANCQCVACIEQANPFLTKNRQRLAQQKSRLPCPKKIDTQRLFWQRYKAGVPGYDLFGEPSNHFEYVVYYGKDGPLADTSDYIPPTSWDEIDSSNSDHFPPLSLRSLATLKVLRQKPKVQWY